MEYFGNKNILFFFKHGIFRNIPEIFGIWNIPQKSSYNKNIKNFGIWNIPRIFQKKSDTTKIYKILEYGIFHGIFLEYSKKYITTVGGVKFNQGS